MFNGAIKLEGITGDDLLDLGARVSCLGEIISLIAFQEAKDQDTNFYSFGEALGRIIQDYGTILESTIEQNYAYINPALEEGWAKDEERRQRREQGLVDPPLTAEEILAQPYLYTRGGEFTETAEMSRREWAEKRAKELNNTLGFKRQRDVKPEEELARHLRARAAVREGLGEVVPGNGLKVGAATG